MANTTYQVILSTEGKHTIMASTDDPAKVNQALAWAKATYDAVVARYGLKKDQYHKDNGNGESVPVCGMHQAPMVRVDGKRGPFWSCHKRNPDGSFCSYRPKGQ